LKFSWLDRIEDYPDDLALAAPAAAAMEPLLGRNLPETAQ
jgi:hypothetical protein